MGRGGWGVRGEEVGDSGRDIGIICGSDGISEP